MRTLLRKSKALVKKSAASTRLSIDQKLGPSRNSPFCPACGLRGPLVQQAALWPELIEQWEISPQWAAWFDQREGHQCPHCGSSLRAQQLAENIVALFNAKVGAQATNLARLCAQQSTHHLSVAEINSAGSLHPFLNQLPLLCYSEFGSSDPDVPSEDLTKLSYPDATFDYVITSETLEHVPDVDLALGEIRRVLKPGGSHIFTVPMVEEQSQTRQRASVEAGQIVHHLPKSYHGIPDQGQEDYLVFYEFGGDFIRRVEQSGFALKLMRSSTNPAVITFVATRKEERTEGKSKSQMNSQTTPLDFTGERMVPENADHLTFWEHIYRYRFATQFVKGKRVLDIACGEGYGSAALKKAGAASVVGVDISEETCAHARRKYGVDARVGDATEIPLDDNSIDVVVSFETIEHIENPALFVDECARVLKPGGLAIISTPNVDIYQELAGDNPFHCSEMSQSEFVELLESRFENCKLYSQRTQRAAWWSLRGMSTPTWPLLYVRGVGRLGNRLRAIYGERSVERNTRQFRSKPVQAIRNRDKMLSSLFNNYQVRRHRAFHREEPTYFVAVVSHPRADISIDNSRVSP